MAALNYFLLFFDIQSSESISVWMDVSKYMSMYSLYISEQLKGNPNPSDIFFPSLYLKSRNLGKDQSD